MGRRGESVIGALAFEVTPAAIFGSAAAFAGATLLGLPHFALEPVAGGAAAFGFAWLVLRSLGRAKGARLPLPDFDQGELDRELELAAGELGNFSAEQLDVAEEFEDHADELILEEVVIPADPDSRVVRLFKPDGTPTAGELQQRIERHLRSGPQAVPDATQELHEALAALRQSLR